MSTHFPPSLTAARILLFAFTGVSLLSGGNNLYFTGFSSLDAVAPTLIFILTPGVASFLLAFFLPRGGPAVFWLLIAMCVFWTFSALGNIGKDPAWILHICWPLLLAVFTTRKASRTYLLHRTRDGEQKEREDASPKQAH
ncbi:hypothetical protein [Nocardiopsis potens]|uniref:hypothetical protein n=1 Tax=Nocardiopsis potens TaxID=1246458 RepID=UPI00034BCFB0|nr:hypothetical protein [Nocardiopsis potens]